MREWGICWGVLVNGDVLGNFFNICNVYRMKDNEFGLFWNW